MVTSNRVYVHFDKLCEFMIRELVDCKAKPLGWAIAMSHINKLPQYKYRSDINQFLPVDIKGIKLTPRSIRSALDAISHLLTEEAPGVCSLASEAKSQLAEYGESDPIIIVRTINTAAPAAPAPAPAAPVKKRRNKKEWGYANALFAGPDQSWFDFHIANDVVKLAKKEFKDMDAFCAWRVDKKRPGLKTTIIQVRMEYRIYAAPVVDLNEMKPAKAAEAPQYRTVNLTSKGTDNEK